MKEAPDSRGGPSRNAMSTVPKDASDANTETPTGGVPGVRAPGPPSHWRLGFWSLIVTQFQGAFNDNGLKFLVFYLIVERNFPAAVRDRFILLVGALFAIPFILFSLAGGYFADRYSKRTVTIGTKLFEIGVGLFAIAALAAGNLTMEAAAVFLISTQGALFGPSKYGLLPELLPENKLSWGNGVIELGTFLASITAVMFAGFLADAFRGRHFWSGVIFLGLTMIGLFTSLGISRVPAANPARRFRANPFSDLGGQLRIIAGDRVLGWAVVGNTYLWFLAALLQFVIVVYGHDVLRVDEARDQLFTGRGGNRHRGGQPGRGLPIARENRIPPGSSWRDRNVSFRISGFAARPWRMAGASGSLFARIFRRLLRCSTQRADPASAKARGERRRHRRCESALLRRCVPRRGSLFCAFLGRPPSSRPDFSCRSDMTLVATFYAIFLMPDSQ